MGFFKKIGELLSGDGNGTEKKVKTNVETDASVDGDNLSVDCSEETRAAIKKSLLKSLNTLYGFNRTACTGQTLNVCIDTTNTMLFNAYVNNKFDDELKEYLYNEAGYNMGNIVLLNGSPESSEQNNFVRIKVEGVSVWYNMDDVKHDRSAQTVHYSPELTAYVSIAGGRGKLLQERYELSGKHNGPYNIGRGQMPMTKRGIRENHIVIDENIQDINSFVSRSQAHIGFSEQIGFYLQVEYEGSRMAGNRTRIFRGEKIIELDNVMLQEPLQNGDLIELGKAVMLKFEENDTSNQ